MLILERNNEVYMQEECGSSPRELDVMLQIFRVHLKSFKSKDTWKIYLTVKSNA